MGKSKDFADLLEGFLKSNELDWDATKKIVEFTVWKIEQEKLKSLNDDLGIAVIQEKSALTRVKEKIAEQPSVEEEIVEEEQESIEEEEPVKEKPKSNEDKIRALIKAKKPK